VYDIYRVTEVFDCGSWFLYDFHHVLTPFITFLFLPLMSSSPFSCLNLRWWYPSDNGWQVLFGNMLETLGLYTIHFESSLTWIALPPSELCPAKRRQLSVMGQKRCRKKASLFRGTSPQRMEICPRPWPCVPHYARGMGITVGKEGLRLPGRECRLKL
jgi:hypothetical protein